MKEFIELEQLEVSPEIALLLEDDGHVRDPEFNLRNYTGPRNLDEALSYSSRADEIWELNHISRLMGCADLRVVRVGLGGSKYDTFEAEDYFCLSAKGINLVALCEVDKRFPGPDGVVRHFIWAFVSMRYSVCERWKQLTYYKAYAAQIDVEFQLPPALITDVSWVLEFGPWWQFPVSVATRQIHVYTDYLVEHFFASQEFDAIISLAANWTRRYDKKLDDFDLMFKDFQVFLPLDFWESDFN